MNLYLKASRYNDRWLQCLQRCMVYLCRKNDNCSTDPTRYSCIHNYMVSLFDDLTRILNFICAQTIPSFYN